MPIHLRKRTPGGGSCEQNDTAARVANRSLADHVDRWQAAERYAFTRDGIDGLRERSDVAIGAALRRMRRNGPSKA